MDTIKRINHFMAERNWTSYKLAMESGLSTSTIANIYRRNTIPSLSTLESICQAFGITLSQFFAEDSDFDSIQLSPQQKDLFHHWIALTDTQKELIYGIIKEMQSSK